MSKMPDIDIVVEVVTKGVRLVDEYCVDSIDAARVVNKGKKSGLVDSYIAEYITKTILARDTGSVELDSSGSRRGRMEKIITKVLESCGFKKPMFVYKFANDKTENADCKQQNVDEKIDEILIHVRNIEQILLCSDKLTHWRDKKQSASNDESKSDADYLKSIYETFGRDSVEEVAN